MRYFYSLAIVLFCVSGLFSQHVDFAPFTGNPVVKAFASKANLQTKAFLQRQYGIDPNEQASNRDGLNGCPPDLPFDKIILEAGETKIIDVDTFGLAIGPALPTITLLTDPPLAFGSAVYNDTFNTVTYTANLNISSFETDTVRLRYQQGGTVDTILKIAFDIRRKGRTIVADAALVAAGGMFDYCLDDELDFPFPRRCFEFVDCPDDYDGDGYQFQYFYNDTCLIYLASRFPGTDTVCLRICDGIGICDIFKIPFQVIGDTLSIASDPFFEDFSTSSGPYPSLQRWLEDDVFVNNTFSKDPPSVGMATFDGLDRNGRPYSLNAGGIADRLTSKPINLSSFNANSDVYLRFFLSPKGFGQEPEDDDFTVEFRNKNKEWVEVLRVNGTGNLPLETVPPFSFYAIKVENSEYFHSGFQIRFSAENSPGGYGDWWHLDYIHLDRFSTDVNNFSDLAFATAPGTFLKNYTSMPLNQLKANVSGEIKNETIANGNVKIDDITISNRTNGVSLNFASSQAKFSEVPNSSPIAGTFVVASANESLTDAQNHKSLEVGMPQTIREELVTALGNLTDNGPKVLETEYWMVGNATEQDGFRTNDTIRTKTVFSDYFAHDDGTAELQFFWVQAQGGEETAIRYKTNVADSLKGIRFMFPHFTFFDIEGQFFNLKVWHGDENLPIGDPIYVQTLMKPFFADEQFDTLQGFTTYVLEDVFGNATPLKIGADSFFYVGFEQVTSTPRGIPVGYDLNNACQCNVRKKTNTWIPFSNNDPKGALMIRPVFGGVQNTWNSTNEQAGAAPLFQIFPNPASVQLNIGLEQGNHTDYRYAVFNGSGQMVRQGELAPTIAMDGLPSGNYYLQTVHKKQGDIAVQSFTLIAEP